MASIRILGIAPYEGMKSLMEQAAESFPGIRLEAHTANLEEGAEIVRSLPEHIYDCIISRGGTATLIRRETDIPVVEVQISMYDILRVIKLAENYSQKYAIVGFPNITKPAHTLCDLLQYNIDIFTIRHRSEAEQLLQQLQLQGYHMVISDMVTHTKAQEMGMDAFLITSGIESIQDALDKAVQICTAFHKSRIENQILRTAVRNEELNVIVLNSEKNMTFAMPQKPDEDLVKELRLRTRELSSRHAVRFLVNERGTLYTITGNIAEAENSTYYVFSYKSAKIPLRSGKTGIRSWAKSECEHAFRNSFYSISGVMGELEQSVSAVAHSRQPVMIAGELGTGKETIARALYLRGARSSKPFVEINCEYITDKTWDFLMNHPNSPLNENGYTLYFQNLDSLSKQQTDELSSMIQETILSRRMRLIFSCVASEDEPLSDRCQTLVMRLGCMTLRLPSLRSRSDEIPSLASIYLNNLNLELGKQISGFEPKAIEQLQKYNWPGNYTQFEQVLTSLATLSSSAYIRSSSVADALYKERSLMRKKIPQQNSDSAEPRTLDEIIKDAIQNAINANNGNQTAAAKQLGISRTTLWRQIGK